MYGSIELPEIGLAGSPSDRSASPPSGPPQPRQSHTRHTMKVLTSDMIRDPALYANIVNVLGMVLYVCLDYERGYITENPIFGTDGFIVGAIAFLLDAFLYWWAWEGAIPKPDLPSISAEYLNIFGSILYVQTSYLYQYESLSVYLADSVYIIEAFATLVFFASGCCGFFSWMVEFEIPSSAFSSTYASEHSVELLEGAETKQRRRFRWTFSNVYTVCKVAFADLDFWAHIFNILPAVVYVVSSTGTLQLHFESRDDLLQSAVSPSWNTSVTQGATASDSLQRSFGAAMTSATSVSGAWAAAGAGRLLRSVRGRSVPPASSVVSRHSDRRLDYLSGTAIAQSLGNAAPSLKGLADNQGGNLRRPNLLVAMSRAYIIGDVLWAVDAILCTVAWYKGWMDFYAEQEAEQGGLGGASGGSGADKDGGVWQVTVASEEEEEGYHVLLGWHDPFMSVWRTALGRLAAALACIGISSAARKQLGLPDKADDLYGIDSGEARHSRIGSEGWSKAIESGGW